MKTTILTRKIELVVMAATAEEKTAQWTWLRQLNKDVFKAYNLVMNNQYFNELFTERILKTDPELMDKRESLDTQIEKLTKLMKELKANHEEKKKAEDARAKLYKQMNMLTKEAREKAVQFYLTSEQNTTYQLLGKKFPDMPSYVRSVLNMDVCQQFKNAIFDVTNGKQTLPTFREGVPIPFDKKAMRFYSETNAEGEVELGMHWVNDIKFMFRFGNDRSNNRSIIEKVMSNDASVKYDCSNSKIKIDGKKIYLFLAVAIPDSDNAPNPEIVVGVNLGVVVPAYCSLNIGKDRLAIGDINDFFRLRVQMQARRKRLQKQLKATRGGRGREKKLKALERIGQCEANFRNSYNHMISSNIVKFAKKHGAGTIVMELLEGYGKDVPDSIILRNWSFFDLHQKIEYKAKRESIQVIYNDPYHISKICSVCRTFDENNLKDRDTFICQNPECKEHGKKVFSDYNASRNNALHFTPVTKKEDCQFYKLKLEEKEQA